jgi:aquaporin Z
MGKYLAEFIGTFFLTLTIGCTVLTQMPLAPLAIGGVLAAMVFAGGHVSGAHFNPAVSVAVLVRGKMLGRELVPYVVAQSAGATVAALAARFITGVTPQQALSASGRDLGVATLAEFVWTFALAYVVLNVATSRSHPDNHFYGAAIGLTVMAGAAALGGVSGGVFNPAVALGLGTAGMLSWAVVPIYVAVQSVAGLLAALTFHALNPHEREADGEIGGDAAVPGQRSAVADETVPPTTPGAYAHDS